MATRTKTKHQPATLYLIEFAGDPPTYVNAITGADPVTDPRHARKWTLPADAEVHLESNVHRYGGMEYTVVPYQV